MDEKYKAIEEIEAEMDSLNEYNNELSQQQFSFYNEEREKEIKFNDKRLDELLSEYNQLLAETRQ